MKSKLREEDEHNKDQMPMTEEEIPLLDELVVPGGDAAAAKAKTTTEPANGTNGASNAASSATDRQSREPSARPANGVGAETPSREPRTIEKREPHTVEKQEPRADESKSLFELSVEKIVDEAMQRYFDEARKEITQKIIDEVRSRLQGATRPRG